MTSYVKAKNGLASNVGTVLYIIREMCKRNSPPRSENVFKRKQGRLPTKRENVTVFINRNPDQSGRDVLGTGQFENVRNTWGLPFFR